MRLAILVCALATLVSPALAGVQRPNLAAMSNAEFVKFLGADPGRATTAIVLGRGDTPACPEVRNHGAPQPQGGLLDRIMRALFGTVG